MRPMLPCRERGVRPGKRDAGSIPAASPCTYSESRNSGLGEARGLSERGMDCNLKLVLWGVRELITHKPSGGSLGAKDAIADRPTDGSCMLLKFACLPDDLCFANGASYVPIIFDRLVSTLPRLNCHQEYEKHRGEVCIYYVGNVP